MPIQLFFMLQLYQRTGWSTSLNAEYFCKAGRGPPCDTYMVAYVCPRLAFLLEEEIEGYGYAPGPHLYPL